MSRARLAQGSSFVVGALVLLSSSACASRGSNAPAPQNGNTNDASVAPQCAASGGVNIDEVIERTFEGAQVKAELKKQYLARQGELDAEQASLEKEKDDLEKQSKVLNKEALTARLTAFQQRLVALQEKMVRYQKQLTDLEARLVEKGRARVRAFIHARGDELAGSLFAIADDAKTTLWLARGCEKAWVAPSVNLTDAVVERYEATHGAIPGETTM